MARCRRGIEEKPMRAIKRNGFGALIAAAALACVFGAEPAQAQICSDPVLVASNLFTSIGTLVDLDPTPSEATCEKIAKSEVAGCNKSVGNAAKCNDTLNAARAQAKNAICQTFVDPEERETCLESVQDELSALAEATKNAASVGLDNCADFSSSIVALCLGDSL
jgi:hypothetical protein